jgi:GMP synthase (glutamine-hydrolysing)
VKPFLLLAIRAEDAAADNEYDSFLTLAGLGEGELRRIRLEQRALGHVDLRDWSGIMLGDGPFNYSDPEELKTPVQRRVEADLSGLLDQVVSADFPFLGTGYGIGALGRHQGAVIDRRFAEPVGAVEVTLTPPGRRDPLLGELPATFQAFTGHKEAVSRLPGHAVLLASSAACPVQAFRVGANVYATQFHPELDVAGLRTRIDVYKHAGYFNPDQAKEIMAEAARSDVTWPPAILRGFVRRYGQGHFNRGSNTLAVGADWDQDYDWRPPQSLSRTLRKVADSSGQEPAPRKELSATDERRQKEDEFAALNNESDAYSSAGLAAVNERPHSIYSRIGPPPGESDE